MLLLSIRRAAGWLFAAVATLEPRAVVFMDFDQIDKILDYAIARDYARRQRNYRRLLHVHPQGLRMTLLSHPDGEMPDMRAVSSTR